MKQSFFKSGLGLLTAAFIGSTAMAQDVHFTQFDAQPMLINPAFTGAFNGNYRASVIYRDQWRSALGAAAFKTYAASFDMPIVRDISIDDYLAAGVQLYNDVAGDGNLSNTTVMLSVAYHKFLGTDGRKALTVGLQGGYTHKSIDLSKLYFGDEFIDGNIGRGTTAENLYNNTSSYVINGGLAWSHAISAKVSYILGAGVNNINQPLESLNRRKANSQVGLALRYTGQAGAVINLNDRFSLRPAALYQSQASATELVVGNEFHYKLGSDPELPTRPAVFAGLWYRMNDAAMATVGVEWSSFRLGASYDYNTSDLKASTGGNGGFEISLRYVAPNPLDFARRLIYPCSRF